MSKVLSSNAVVQSVNNIHSNYDVSSQHDNNDSYTSQYSDLIERRKDPPDDERCADDVLGLKKGDLTYEIRSINIVDHVVWRVFDDGYLVRSMTTDDARIVQDWYNNNMGVTSRFDLETALGIFGSGSRGFYIGEWKGKVIASYIALPWGNNIFYGSMYYVDEPYRGRSFGTRLRDIIALEHLDDGLLCIDAVHGKVADGNASKCGYTFSHDTYRYHGRALSSYGYDNYLHHDFKVLPIDQVNMFNLLNYDDERFITRGNSRRHDFIRRWTTLPGGATYVAFDVVTGHIVGYGCRRQCIAKGQHQIGPLFADSDCVAETLMSALCICVAGEDVTINVCSRNEAAVRMCEETFQLTRLFAAHRQHLNGDPQEFRSTTYALTSIDVCGF